MTNYESRIIDVYNANLALTSSGGIKSIGEHRQSITAGVISYGYSKTLVGSENVTEKGVKIAVYSDSIDLFDTDTQFEFTKKMIASGEGKSMRLKYLGKFDTIEKQKHRFNGTNKEQ